MPTLDFKGKQFIYAHHLTVPFRMLLEDSWRETLNEAIDDYSTSL